MGEWERKRTANHSPPRPTQHGWQAFGLVLVPWWDKRVNCVPPVAVGGSNQTPPTQKIRTQRRPPPSASPLCWCPMTFLCRRCTPATVLVVVAVIVVCLGLLPSPGMSSSCSSTLPKHTVTPTYPFLPHIHSRRFFPFRLLLFPWPASPCLLCPTTRQEDAGP